MTPDQIERAMIVEFSVHGNAIAKSKNRTERRERIRQAIYASGQMAWKFSDTQMTYADAFKACFSERLDRRAAQCELPEPEDEVEDELGDEPE